MIKVLLIDDEAPARNLIREYISEVPEFTIVGECENGFDAYKVIQQLKPDLIFLDVQMPKLNGFEMLELLEERPFVIFTTAHEQFALSAFEQNALDYLLKPISKERFHKAIQKWKSQTSKTLPALTSNSEIPVLTTSRIAVKHNNELIVIPASQVLYVEAFDDYVKIATTKSVYLKKSTLSQVEKGLDPSIFMRIHRSFLVNLQELTGIEPMEKNSYLALLRSGKKIPISRNNYSELKKRLGF